MGRAGEQTRAGVSQGGPAGLHPALGPSRHGPLRFLHTGPGPAAPGSPTACCPFLRSGHISFAGGLGRGGGRGPPSGASRLWGAPPAPMPTGSDRSLPLSGGRTAGREGGGGRAQPRACRPERPPLQALGRLLRHLHAPHSRRPRGGGWGSPGRVCTLARPRVSEEGEFAASTCLGLRHARKPLSGVRFSGATGSPTVGQNLVSHARWAHTARSVAVRTVGWPLLKAARSRARTRLLCRSKLDRGPTALCAHEEAVAGSGVRLGNGFPRP